jgi:hypothetical protein
MISLIASCRTVFLRTNLARVKASKDQKIRSAELRTHLARDDEFVLGSNFPRIHWYMLIGKLLGRGIVLKNFTDNEYVKNCMGV